MDMCIKCNHTNVWITLFYDCSATSCKTDPIEAIGTVQSFFIFRLFLFGGVSGSAAPAKFSFRIFISGVGLLSKCPACENSDLAFLCFPDDW